MANIAYYGSHNANIAVEENGKIITVIEIERLNGYKNSGVSQYKVPKCRGIDDLNDLVKEVLKLIEKNFGITEYENCVAMHTDVIFDKLYMTHHVIPAKNFVYYNHHKAHAASTFYQSPYKEALIFSFDGGGDDGMFNIYKCIRGEEPELLERINNPIHNSPHVGYDLGFPYMMFAHYLKDIKLEWISDGNLIYPGKIMGLASYGNIIDEWIEPFTQVYKTGCNGLNYEEILQELGKKINVEFNLQNRLEGQIAYDIAATSQKVFEECFLEVVKPYMEQYKELPICITGGCALNIILNTRIVTEFNRDVFVAPNSNDGGLAVGMLAAIIKPEEPIDITYSGIPILDMDMFQHYYQNTSWWKDIFDISKIISDIVDGKIIGIMRGNSEHGPRALGNRSIICNPAIADMKDILNKKVKNREWYRPFAPVVRLEDVSKYFEWEKESRWMSFCPKVKEEWKEKLPAITHVDGTARVQTVTREQNEFIYDLLTELDKQTGVGVLINTSFNVNGKPILSSVKEAFEVFEKTELDKLIIENYYITK